MLGGRGGEWLVPTLSTLVAAATLTWALLATHPDAAVAPARSPERTAEAFARAYQARDFAGAAILASGSLRRSLEVRARSARLQGKRGRPQAARQLVIEECFMLAERKLRFAGVLAERDAPEAHGWPISITVGQHGDGYLAEALSWPQGPPPDER